MFPFSDAFPTNPIPVSLLARWDSIYTNKPSFFMKTLLSVLFGVAVVSTSATAQIPGPVPPADGSWHDVRLAQAETRLRKPLPPPAGGFWVVEDQTGARRPVIVRYYNDRRQELRADTLTRKRLNLKHRAVVGRLNEQLSALLDKPIPPTPVAYRQP